MTTSNGHALVAAIAIALSSPAFAASDRFDCKGVVTFADAMTRAVHIGFDAESGTVLLRSCAKYAELAGYCHGGVLHLADHHFQFGGVDNVENARITAALYRDDAVRADGYDAPWLKVYFVGRCEPAKGRWR
jgi:hypothetical protein